ncbi:MAG TPA: RagB/SusD family nutrient uptake outer membrane protein, partial [Xylanibacter oryzae]|nr:RagB/SusD family nutrient uptake outer membrane protein [Xylanibacter oryzae]
MKKYKLLISALMLALAGTVATSCSDYLDKESDLTLSGEQIFSKYENTRGFLANVYTYLPDPFAGYSNGQFLAASRDCMTDNSLSYWNVHYYHSVLNDSYDATNHYFAITYWTNDLKGIRAANQFMKDARESVIGNAEKSGDDNKLYTRNVAEARLIRAIMHFDMAAWFGAIPIIGNGADGSPIVFDPSNTAGMNMTRTSCADALKWIADECDAVKDVLPFRYSNESENWGRVNGAAAYALKSRALLYRASALNNPTNDQTYWKAAADAALDFINKNKSQSNPYELYTTSDNDVTQNYYQCFVSTPHLNNEYILCRSEWNTREIELFLAPCGFSGNVNSVGRTNPTQNLVDSYEMANGLTIDDANSGYDPQNPYKNRDPRLEQTILHQGSVWGDPQQDEQRKVDVSYPNGKDYQDLHGGTTTGYYTKKFLNNM